MLNLSKTRFIAMGLDIWIFLLLLALLPITKLEYFIPLVLFCYIFYFVIFPFIFRGYTLAGFLFGWRIIDIDESKNISFWMLLKRSIYAIKITLLTFWKIKVNTNGQTMYDEKYNTNVTNRNMKASKKGEYFFIFYFILSAILFFIILFFISQISQVLFK